LTPFFACARFWCVKNQKSQTRKEVIIVTEVDFNKKGEFQIRKPRRQKGQRDPNRRRRIVREFIGLVYTEIEYDDGEIIGRID
jgi:hypothetical protein